MMLQQPLMLWFLVALVPLAAIYLLKVRPTRKKTTVWFLWDTLLNEKKASALFQRLRDIFSLILMTLLFLACVFAMTHPMSSSSEKRYDLIILLDNSISMRAVEGGTTRLEKAKKVARDIVRAMHLERRAVLATVADNAQYKVNLTSNQRELIKGIKAVEATELPLRYDALKGFCENSKFLKDVRTIFITDGCFERYDAVDGVEVFKVGGPVGNLGITGFDMVRLPGAGDKLGLFFRISSSFASEQNLDVTLSHETKENIVRVIPVTVKPGNNKPETFTLDGVDDGKWILAIEVKDALADDNEAYAVVPERKPVNVAINAKEGGVFFKKCIEAFEDEAVGLRHVESGQEVTISCGNAGDPEAKHQVIFNPAGESPFWGGLGEKLTGAMAKVILSDHEVLKFCELDGYLFTGGKTMSAPEDALVLVESVDGVPLIYKTLSGERTAYIVNMDPVESEFFLSAYFPIMVYAISRDLTGRSMEFQASYRPGTKLSDKYLDKLGFHDISDDIVYACSTPGFHESYLDNSKVRDTHKPIERGWPASHILLVLGLALAVLESILYHRRKVG